MNEDFELQSLRYLLDQMSPEERRRFDGQLAGDRAATALFRSYADALAAHMTTQSAGKASLRQEEAELILGRLRFEALPAASKKREKRTAWKLWAWPVAAALLLALNLWQFLHAPEPKPSAAPSTANQDQVQASSKAPLQIEKSPPPSILTTPVLPVRHGLVLGETPPPSGLRLQLHAPATSAPLHSETPLLPQTSSVSPVTTTAAKLQTTPTFSPNEAMLLWLRSHSTAKSPEIHFPPMTTTRGKLDNLLYLTPNPSPPQFIFIKEALPTPSALQKP